jgi:hypothetical protein
MFERLNGKGKNFVGKNLQKKPAKIKGQGHLKKTNKITSSNYL